MMTTSTSCTLSMCVQRMRNQQKGSHDLNIIFNLSKDLATKQSCNPVEVPILRLRTTQSDILKRRPTLKDPEHRLKK